MTVCVPMNDLYVWRIYLFDFPFEHINTNGIISLLFTEYFLNMLSTLGTGRDDLYKACQLY